MPYSEELDREYTVEEARLWREVQFTSKSGPTATVRVLPIAEGMGISGERVGQFVRTWENDDLVRAIGPSDRKVTLTSFGRRFTFEESYSDLEE